jgi:hypothetical protein
MHILTETINLAVQYDSLDSNVKSTAAQASVGTIPLSLCDGPSSGLAFVRRVGGEGVSVCLSDGLEILRFNGKLVVVHSPAPSIICTPPHIL